MDNIYTWDGPGWYASAGKYFAGSSYTDTRKVNMDGWRNDEVGQASRQQGYGTARWHDTEQALRQALGLE